MCEWYMFPLGWRNCWEKKASQLSLNPLFLVLLNTHLPHFLLSSNQSQWLAMANVSHNNYLISLYNYIFKLKLLMVASLKDAGKHGIM